MSNQGSGLRTVVDVWRHRLSLSAAQTAFRWKTSEGWKDMTYGEVDSEARRLAAGLAGWGMTAGDRVCVLSQTRLEWMLADIGLSFYGSACVPIYASSTAEQCAFIVRNCGARYALVEDAAQLEKLLPLLGDGLRVVTIAGDAKLEKADGKGRTEVKMADVLSAAGAGRSQIRTLSEIMEAGKAALADAKVAAELDARSNAVKESDLFTIIYTSGTTGDPKGVVLTHGHVTSNITSASRALTIGSEDVQLLFLPLAHVLAREVTWAPIVMGGITAFAESIAKLKENLTEVRPTFLVGVPRVFEKFYAGVQAGARQGSAIKKALVKWGFGVGARNAAARRAGGAGGGLAFSLADKLVLSKLRAKLGLERCRFLISGGAPLSAEIAEFFHSVGLLVLEGYGLTETVGAAFVNRMDRYRFGTVGPALDIVECKIAEDGEILLRGPSVFSEYYRNPAATAESVDEGGWFHTGDIGQLEDGFLRITDRKKDLIVLAGGKKVAPQALENALKARTKVLGQVMVHGDKRPYCIALVTLNEETVKRAGGGDHAKAAADSGVKAEVKAEIDALNATLASFETIKRFAILPADLTEATGELTPSMKVKRKVVVEKHKTLIDGLYAGGGGD